MRKRFLVLLAAIVGMTVNDAPLWAQINSLKTLTDAINEAPEGGTVVLTDDIMDAHSSNNSAIHIYKSLTLDGNGFTISGSSMQNILAVMDGEGTVTIKNVTIRNIAENKPVEGKGYNDITVYKRGIEESKKVILDKVTLAGTGGSGLLVNSSNVSAMSLTVRPHVWGGVNLDNEDTPAIKPVFTLDDGSVLFGLLQIWADKADASDWFSKSGWAVSNAIQGKTVWTNKLSDGGLTYAVDFTEELKLVVDLINANLLSVTKIILNPTEEYVLTNSLSLTKGLTLEGKSGGKPVVRITNDQDAFVINATEGNVTFKNIHIRGDKEATLNGNRNSTAIVFPNPNKFAGTLSLDNVLIEGYFFGLSSGAVAAQQSAPKNTLSVSDCVFKDCLHKAIYTENSEVTIQRTKFDNCANTTKPGSGWFTAVAVDINLKYGAYNQVKVTDCEFLQNGITAIQPPTSAFPDAIAYSTALAVKARNDGSYASNPATLAKAIVTGNRFVKNSLGIQFGEPQNNAKNGLVEMSVSNNSFTENHNDIINSSADTTVASVVCNLKGLQDALAYCAQGATIKLQDGEFVLPSYLNITKNISLEGNGGRTVLKPSADFTSSADGGTKYLITVQNNVNVALKNFVVDGMNAKGKAAYRGGVNIYGSSAELQNITSQNNNATGVTVNDSKVSVSGLITSGNGWGGVNVDKGTPALTFLSGTILDADPIYSDLEGSASDSTVANYITFINGGWKGEKDSERNKYVWKLKAIVPVLTAPKASLVDAGQTLSVSLLTDGKAMVGNTEIPGVFKWNEPATIVKEGTNSYRVIFTPNDLVRYAPAGIDVEMKDVKQYYTVVVGKSMHGRIVADKTNAANRYEKNTVLRLSAEADPNYRFLKWAGNASSSYAVVKDDTLTAEFEPVMHSVTIIKTGSGSVKVNGADATNITVQQGTILTVVANPDAGFVLDKFTCTEGKVISNGVVTVDKPFSISAGFIAKESKMVVKVAPTGNGKILLFDKNSNAVPAGSAVESGAELKVVAMADQGYVLQGNTLKNNGTEIPEGKITVLADANITATFDLQSYGVIRPETITGGRLSITNDGEEVNGEVQYGTELKVSVLPDTGYKLLSIVVNGKEIPNNGTCRVDGKTEVNATMRKLATVAIDETEQSYVYDGAAKSFVLKTTPSGIGGITVQYQKGEEGVKSSVLPTEAGIYNVYLSREADDVYAALTEKVLADGLVIERAVLADVEVPVADSQGTIETKSDKGTYAWGNVAASDGIKEAVFTPKSQNYKNVSFYIPESASSSNLIPITYTWPEEQRILSRSATIKSGISLAIIINGGTPNGNKVTLWNGSKVLTSGDLYVGQKITLKAVPANGYSGNASWVVTDVSSGSKAPVIRESSGSEAVVTLTDEGNIVEVTFDEKEEPSFPGLGGADRIYNGSVFCGKAPVIQSGDVSDNWQLSFKQQGVVIPNPTDAGAYDVYYSRPADINYKAVVEKLYSDKLVIGKKETTVSSNNTASDILKGQSLSQSIIFASADVDGVFTWETPNSIMTKEGEQTHTIIFTPGNSNYTVVNNSQATLKVIDTKTDLRTLTLTVNGAENGEPVVMTLNDATVVSGALVTKGDILKVSATPRSGYNAAVSVKNASVVSGGYVVGESGNVEVTVTYSQVSVPDPVVNVSGVSLNKSRLNIGRGETETLIATVTPSNATNPAVTWITSDAAVATVDANGKVTAVKEGRATITVRTGDGGYTATCEVIISFLVGLDEDVANTKIYVQDGSICIEPISPMNVIVVNVAGHLLHHEKISNIVRIPVEAGIYFVKFGFDNKMVVRKVTVR